MKQKNNKEDFLVHLLLGTIGASLLGNLLTDKGTHRVGKGKGKGINSAGELVMETISIFNCALFFN